MDSVVDSVVDSIMDSVVDMGIDMVMDNNSLQETTGMHSIVFVFTGLFLYSIYCTLQWAYM